MKYISCDSVSEMDIEAEVTKEIERIGHKVQTLRNAHDIKQDKLAEDASISTRALQTLESGKGNPSLRTLISVLKAMAAPMSVLAVSESTEALESEAVTLERAALIITLTGRLSSLDHKELAALDSMAQRFLQRRASRSSSSSI